jgi:type I restriction enzyme S subunit
MSEPWSVVRFDEILKRVERRFMIDDGHFYRCVGVRWYGQGTFVRQQLVGADIVRKEQWIIEPGDIVYNKLFAWKGVFAVADETINGCIVSDKFPTYRADNRRVDLGWLKWYFRTPDMARQAQNLSKGAAAISKLTLNPPDFWKLSIPLPTLAEQRGIVAQIEELAAKIEETRELRQQAAAEAEVLVSRAASAILDDDRWQFSRLSEVLIESPRNGLSPKPEVHTAGRRMLRINAVSSSPNRFVDLSAYKKVEVSDDEARPYVLQHEDVFIVRYNADLNRVAKAAIFKGETNAVFPDKLMRLRPNREMMTPDFLVYALGSRRVRDQIEELGKTTAGQIGVSGTDAKSFIVPVPPLPEQSRIVSYLDSLQIKVDALKSLQAETAAELVALLPSILDKAFKGEL